MQLACETDDIDRAIEELKLALPVRITPAAGAAPRPANGERGSVTEIRLPFPPSVNEAYGNNKRGKGRGRFAMPVLKAWREQAAWELRAQKAQPVPFRCMVVIDIDDKRQGDCANREKVVTDLLVSEGILRGDQKKYVKRVSIGWEPVAGCRVTFVEAA